VLLYIVQVSFANITGGPTGVLVVRFTGGPSGLIVKLLIVLPGGALSVADTLPCAMIKITDCASWWCP
jgi:hypothetical protein